MDEGPGIGHVWEREAIPQDDSVLRHVHISHITNSGNKRMPNEAAFSLRQDERGLSVNWDKYMSVKENFILLGLTYNKANKFIDFTQFKVFKIKVEYIRSLPDVHEVLHDPIFHGDNPPVGRPNNQAHTLILYENDEEIRMKLADYCNENFSNSYCHYDVRLLRDEITSLRERLIENTSKG